MLKLVLGVMLVAGQLSGPGGALPQVLHPDFKAAAPAKSRKAWRSDRVVQRHQGLCDRSDAAIHAETDRCSRRVAGEDGSGCVADDPKAKDQYYVDLPTIKVAVTAAKGRQIRSSRQAEVFLLLEDGWLLFAAGPRREGAASQWT